MTGDERTGRDGPDGRDGREAWQDGFGDDPVERFFAAERDRVTSRAGDDLHWRSIVTQARGRRRRRVHGYLAGAAAAAVVVGAVTAGTALVRADHPALTSASTGQSPSPSSDPSVVPTSGTTSPTTTPVSPSTTSRTTSASSTSPSRSTATDQPVSRSFVATSVSNAGKGTIYALGSAVCGSVRCPSLTRSTDNGSTWRTVHAFAGSVAAAATGAAAQAPNAISQVRFANPMVGWAFGGAAQVTRDGGRTWTPYRHPGAVVLSLETDGSTVYLTSGGPCGADGCAGPLVVSAAPVAASGSAVVGKGPSGSTSARLSGADLALDGGRAYVDPKWAVAPAKAFGSSRVGGSGLLAVTVPPTCAAGSGGSGGSGGGDVDVVTTAGSPGTLFGVCPGDGAAGSISLDVSVSGDGGGSWVHNGSVVVQNGASISVAAADSRHLVAVTGAGAGGGSMTVSADGGRTWSAAGIPAAAAPSGWRWVGAAGGGIYDAVPVAAGPGFWRSTDFGRHWSLVRIGG